MIYPVPVPDALRALAVSVRQAVNTTDSLGVPATAIDNTGPTPPPAAPVTEEPFKPLPGVVHVEAEAFSKSYADPTYPAEQKGEVWVHNSFTGGKQVYFQRNMALTWVEYPIEVPEAGTYAMEIMVAAANRDQVLDVSCGDEKFGTIKIAGTVGLWQKMPQLDIKLNKGQQTLRISAPMQRGVAFRWFELKLKK